MSNKLLIPLVLISLSLLVACSKAPESEQALSEKFVVLSGGTEIGYLHADTQGEALTIDYSFSNNGRGASSQESLLLSERGLPVNWSITGKTVFGNAVDESFEYAEGKATWRASDGEGQAVVSGDAIYVSQSGSPYSMFIYANALLAYNNTLAGLPGGQLSIKLLEQSSLQNALTNEEVSTALYAISGIDLDPSYIMLDQNQRMLAFASPRFAVIREGFTSYDAELRAQVAALNASRFEDIAAKVTHSFDKPVRINNVRVFDSKEMKLSSLQSVLVEGNTIIAIEPVIESPSPDEELIDGQGGTLIPGMFEMHGHMSDNDALMNVLAGVTSVRDMGNEMEVLDSLIDKINTQTLIGPRITKSGFIEGKSEFSAATGEIASTEQEAVDLVKMYAERGDYFQIKIYSSINGDWVPAMTEEARKHGLRVSGHVPAFSTVDEMINAGYNEIAHINQVMLSWVLGRQEDTRTLFRITGMKRFEGLDLNSEIVQNTLNLMVENNIAVDPTIVIHEFGLTARNGVTRAGVRDYIENMPIAVQRNAKQALLNVADEDEDMAYLFAFEKVLDALTMMHERGIMLLPGTDLGGAFELHRELELFQQLGMKNAEILRRATYDMANYLGQSEQLGSIEAGKLADFYLVPGNPLIDLGAIKTIAMVMKDGNVYYPDEVYPEFGIKPFLAQ
jgi:imidazolonepropionase-like amidohydrolase